MKFAEIIDRPDPWGNHAAFVVDLEADWDRLPEGWQFLTENNCYTGWNGGCGCIRWAEVIRS